VFVPTRSPRGLTMKPFVHATDWRLN